MPSGPISHYSQDIVRSIIPQVFKEHVVTDLGIAADRKKDPEKLLEIMIAAEVLKVVKQRRIGMELPG